MHQRTLQQTGGSGSTPIVTKYRNHAGQPPAQVSDILFVAFHYYYYDFAIIYHLCFA
jgi:hypothetical protein